MVPSGLISIGTVLQENGYNVKIIDFNHYYRDFRKDLKTWQPKLIGIGGTTPTRKGSFLTSALSKGTLPHVPIVYGGIHATFTARETIAGISSIDYIIRGEGELSMLLLCDKIIKGASIDLPSIPGLCYRLGNSITLNPSKRIDDLCALPIPNRDLLPYKYTLKMDFLDIPGDFIMTSRGCPAACNFCAASRMFPGGVRLRSIGQVAVEIEQLLSRKKIKGLKIFDSTFTADRRHVEQFCAMIKPYELKWECEIRADTVDDALLHDMKDSGCYYINMGLETSNPSLLKNIAKGISAAQVLSVLDSCDRIGIRKKVFFTFGHIGQTYRDCLNDINFIKANRSRIDFFAVTLGMRIYPGTRLEKNCRELGHIHPSFSWIKSAKSLKNFLVFEFGDVPILFQKDLRASHMVLILFKLLFMRTICSPQYLFQMLANNALLTPLLLKKHAIYSWHRLCRVIDYPGTNALRGSAE
jgi:radical SAM superfamily enzyme YgiQ (UPF0313 family)